MGKELLTDEEVKELLKSSEKFPLKVYDKKDVEAMLCAREQPSLFRKIINCLTEFKNEINQAEQMYDCMNIWRDY